MNHKTFFFLSISFQIIKLYAKTKVLQLKLTKILNWFLINYTQPAKMCYPKNTLFLNSVTFASPGRLLSLTSPCGSNFRARYYEFVISIKIRYTPVCVYRLYKKRMKVNRLLCMHSSSDDYCTIMCSSTLLLLR